MWAKATLAPILFARPRRRSEDPRTRTSRSRPGFAGRETHALTVPRLVRLRDDRTFAPQTHDSRPGCCVCPTYPAHGARPVGRCVDALVCLARAMPGPNHKQEPCQIPPSAPLSPSDLSSPVVTAPRAPRPPGPRPDVPTTRPQTPRGGQRGAEGPGGEARFVPGGGGQRGAEGAGQEAGTPLALASLVPGRGRPQTREGYPPSIARARRGWVRPISPLGRGVRPRALARGLLRKGRA